MKFCIDCLFYPNDDFPICGHEKSVQTDPVTGNPDPLHCSTMRSSAGKCGPKAKLFQSLIANGEKNNE